MQAETLTKYATVATKLEERIREHRRKIDAAGNVHDALEQANIALGLMEALNIVRAIMMEEENA